MNDNLRNLTKVTLVAYTKAPHVSLTVDPELDTMFIINRLIVFCSRRIILTQSIDYYYYSISSISRTTFILSASFLRPSIGVSIIIGNLLADL